jgi:hypothetical protein
MMRSLRLLTYVSLSIINGLCYGQVSPLLRCTQQNVEYLVGGAMNQRPLNSQKICGTFESTLGNIDSKNTKLKNFAQIRSKDSLQSLTLTRNNERLDILHQELKSEKESMTELIKSSSPIPKAGTFGEQLNRHKANIAALESEINRLK